MSHRDSRQRFVRILGTRGIPGGHGGFESWAEELALHLTDRGWKVAVYCQTQGGLGVREEIWRGIRLIHIAVPLGGSLGACLFDLYSTLHAVREGTGVAMVFGYNTACLNLLYRLRGIPNLLNMDGLEWKRRKYKSWEKAWLLLNEAVGARSADHLVADHPVIRSRYARWLPERKITVIPYGARPVLRAGTRELERLGVKPREYALVVARPEPENSLLEIVRAYSAAPRPYRLVLAGAFSRTNPYQRQVMDAAGAGVVFAGAVYEHEAIDALRFHALCYVHGHTVGGTNPSLIEALGAGCPVVAHDNLFNRGVAGSAAVYFSGETDCRLEFDRLADPAYGALLEELRWASRQRHRMAFDLSERLDQYHHMLLRWATGEVPIPAPLPEYPALSLPRLPISALKEHAEAELETLEVLR